MSSIYCAKIVNNVVVDLIIVGDPDGMAWCKANLPGTWIQTYPDGAARGKFAAVGDLYNPETDTFSSPEVDPDEPVEEIR